MRLEWTDAQKALQRELRAYFQELMTPELAREIMGGEDGVSEGGGPLYRQALEKMGRDGWLGIGWPKEYGGQGKTAIEQLIFSDEVQRVNFPIPFLTLNSVGPTIAKYGTPKQKQEFLPKILAGKLHVSIGYTEPESGTDLASLRCRAERDGDHYIVNGQKIFTSLAGHADYIWLACRTDPNAPKHRGISLLLVDTKLPGFSVQPMPTVGEVATNSTFYENVRVPCEYLVGEEGQGWGLIVNQLNHERISLVSTGPPTHIFEELLAWARETYLCDEGRMQRVIDRPWVQMRLAEIFVRLEVLRLMTWKQAWVISQDCLQFADASAVKVFGTESFVEIYRRMLEILGLPGLVHRSSRHSLVSGLPELFYRASLILTFGGGTNEIQRDLIAAAGLKMPPTVR